MLDTSAVMVYDVVVAIHISAVVIAFGVTFAYPLIFAAAQRIGDPNGLAWFHKIQGEIGKKIITPGLVVILLAGIYLASDRDYWGEFWVIWGLVATVVLGALGGLVFGPGEQKASELLARDIAAQEGAAGGEGFKPSAEYEAIGRRLGAAGAFSGLLVLVTIFFMAAKPFS